MDTTITIIHQVEVKVLVAVEEQSEEISRKVASTVSRAAAQVLEDWAQSPRGRRIINDVATQAAQKVSGV